MSKSIVEFMVGSKLVVDSNEECQDRVVVEGFSFKEGVDLDETLALVVRGFSQKEGVDLVEACPLVGGFEVPREDPCLQVDESPLQLMNTFAILYFKINELLSML